MTPSDKTSQFDKTLIELRSLIMSGAFEAQTRLSEVAIAERLEVSRTPLRKAMDQLVTEGLIERIETGGCRVASFTREDVLDAIEIRGALEGTAARLAAERGISEQIYQDGLQILDSIDHALSDADQIDFQTYQSGNADFHLLLSKMPGSAMMHRELDRIHMLPLASPSAFLHQHHTSPFFQNNIRRGQEQHKAILDAIYHREGSRAEALAREHARSARDSFNYFTKTEPSLAHEVPGLSLVIKQ